MLKLIKMMMGTWLPVMWVTAVDAGTLTLNTQGLEDLGPDARYEGWLVVDEQPVSTGVFTVNQTGSLSQSVFNVSNDYVDDASAFVLTIEPFPDADPLPADSKLLAGDIQGGTADLSVGHPAAIGDDLTAASGRFQLITPTGGKGGAFSQGIWYVINGIPASAGLSLPALPTGWIYEGWVVDTSTNEATSTGTFGGAEGPDSDGAGPAAGFGPAWPFPGQDYINPPRDLSINHRAVISVEPVPDNLPTPFTLKPLLLPIADQFGNQLMNNNAIQSNPTGLVSLSRGTGAGPQAVPVFGGLSLLLLAGLALLVANRQMRKVATN